LPSDIVSSRELKEEHYKIVNIVVQEIFKLYLLITCGGKMVENKKKLSIGLVVKILVPILIIIVIFAIWISKNSDANSNDNNETIADKSGEEADKLDANEINTKDENTDFELNITGEIDLEQLKSYGIPIVIDFGADSCTPCKEMAPVLEKLNAELKGKAIVRFVDVWKYPDLAQGYPISLIPTQVLIDKDGKPYVPTDTNSAGLIMYETKDTNEHIFTTHEGGITEDALLDMLNKMGMEE